VPRTVETYRTTRKARAVIAVRAREDLRAMLARLPPGRTTEDVEAERVGEAVTRMGRRRPR